MKTITVRNSFGKDEEMAKLTFIARWRSHASDLKRLSMDHYDELAQMEERICEIAGKEFDRIHNRESQS